MNLLQGTILYSSPAGDSMRLEYPLILYTLSLHFLDLCYDILLNKQIQICKITDGHAKETEAMTWNWKQRQPGLQWGAMEELPSPEALKTCM